MHETLARAPRPALWPRSTSLFLLLVGSVLSVLSFAIVLNMPDLGWPANEDVALRATYQAFQQTGVLLVIQDGTIGADSLVPAAADGAPGVYLLASLIGGLTGSATPFPGLAVAMALLVAVPLIWLPTAVARIMTRARAGYALLILPAVLWLVNQGTVLLGTEYGLAPAADAARVSALHGVPASLAFLSLALILLCSTFPLRLVSLLGVTALVGVLAGVGELMSALSGVGVALAVGVLWFLNSRRRWVAGLGGAAVAVTVAILTSIGAMGAVDQARAPHIQVADADPVVSTAFWHDLAVGLSFGREATVEEGVVVAEDELRERFASTDVDIQSGIDVYESFARGHYVAAVQDDPAVTARLYLEKLLYVVKQFGAMVAFILVSFVIALMRRSPQRRLLGASIAIAAPTLVVGLTVAVATSPTLDRFGEIAASLGLLTAVALGALVWSLTSMPSHVRATERSRLSKRAPAPARDPRSHTSVIVPTRNGEAAIGATIRALASRLGPGDEIIVVENGSTDDTTAVLERARGSWSAECELVVLHSGPGLGEALRTGVIASTGQWLLLTADDLPFGFTDFDHFTKLPGSVVVAIGSKAHPASDVTRSRRRVIQSRIFRFLREALLQSQVGDSQGTFWVNGDWVRAFAMLSRETGLMWTTELVLAAEQQGLKVVEVPVSLSDAHETGSSRFRLGDAWRSVVGFIRLAIYKDDYANEAWTRTPTAETEGSPLV